MSPGFEVEYVSLWSENNQNKTSADDFKDVFKVSDLKSSRDLQESEYKSSSWLLVKNWQSYSKSDQAEDDDDKMIENDLF